MQSATTIIVRYAETDQMGIVHHANYPIWFEAARTDWVRQCIGLGYSQLEQMGIGLPLVEFGCRYRCPAHYEDELIVYTKATELSAAKIRFEYEVVRAEGHLLLATGFTLHAWVGKDLRPLNFKKRHPELFEALEKVKEL